MAKSLRRFLQAAPLFIIQFLLRFVSVEGAHRVGLVLGELFFLSRLGRRNTLRTLARALPEWPAQERLRLARSAYRNLCANSLELLVLPRLSQAELLARVEVENPQILARAVAQERGVLLALGHFGRWEWLCPTLRALGYEASPYVGELRNGWADRLINRAREQLSAGAISRQAGMRGLLEALQRKKRLLGLVCDQHFSRKRHWVYFFGQLSSVPPGMPLLARSSGAPVLYTECLPLPGGRMRLCFTPLPPPPAQGAAAAGHNPRQHAARHNADKDATIFAWMDAFSRQLERTVRRSPAHYLWMHRRWREYSVPEWFSPQNRAFLERSARAGFPRPPPRPGQPPPPSPHTPYDPRLPPVFVDRDGVLIREVHYLRSQAQLRLLPGAAQAIRRLNAKGHAVVLVSNQSAVARGLASEAFVEETHRLLQERLAKRGARLDGVYFCPHHPQGQPPYRFAHPDRKPGAGMLLRACRELGLQLQGSWFIGDQPSDLQTGAAQGVIPLLVHTGRGKETAASLPADFATRGGRSFPDLAAAAAWLTTSPQPQQRPQHPQRKR